MFMWITEEILKYYRQETLAERGKRMVPGALYCAIAATVYMMVSPVINVIIFSDLHLIVDWIGLLIHWIESGIVLALAGAIVGWFTENYEGIIWGGVVLAILLLVENLIASLIDGGGVDMVGESVIMALPLVGAGILLAWAIRAAITRHLSIKHQEIAAVRRKQSLQLFVFVLFIGSILGVLSLFGNNSLNTMRSVNDSLQNYATDPLNEWRFPYEKVPDLKDHFGMNYSLYARPSTSMAGVMDITIRFENGYTVTCLVPPTYGNDPLLLDVCNEGTNIVFP